MIGGTPVLGKLWGRVRRRPAAVDDAVSVEVDGIRYDGRALSRPAARGGVWSGWTGRVRRAFAALADGATESRAITDVPWAVGGTLSSASSSQDRALRMGPVFSAVRLIADHVSTLPIKAYRKAGGKRIPRSGLPDLFFRLDEDGELIPWLKRCVTSLMLRGNAYGLITERDELGFPVVIQWLDPSDVSCNDVNPWAPIWYWMGREIPRTDLLHIPWFVVAGKVQGLSPIEAFALTTNTGLKAQEYGETWFDNGGVPPGTFKNSRKEIDQPAAEHISDRLVSAIRTRRPIVYGADWDYNAIVIPPEQAQFIQTLSMTATQIAAIYGLPPEMIGGSTGDPMTYKTEEQFQQRLNAALRPLLVLLESEFSAVLPRFEQVKLNADAVARADLKTRYEAYEIAKRIGLLTDDEIRALEDLPPLPPGQRPQPAPVPVPAAAPRSQLRHLPGKHNQDSHGSDGVGEVAKSAVKDALKLAGRIKLKPGETFAGSATLSASEGRINLARIDRDGERHLRFAAGQGAFEDDANKWRAENKGLTAELDPDATVTLRGELDRMVDEAKRATAEIKRLNRDFDRFYAKHGEEPREKEASQAWRRGLPAEATAELSDLDDRAERLTDEPAAQGSVSGNWADLRFELQMDEVTDSPSWHLIVGVRPKDATDDWGLRDGIHDAWLSPAEVKRLGRLLDSAGSGTARAMQTSHQAALIIRARAYPPTSARPLRAVS